MNLISQNAYAKKIGITRQAISKAVKEGKLPFVLKNKIKKIDLDNEDVKYFSKKSVGQRSVVQKKKTVKRKTPSKVDPDKTGNNGNPSEVDPEIDTEDDVSMYLLEKRLKTANAKKAEIIAMQMEKKYLPRDFIETGLFRYLEKLNSNIERSAAVFVSEVGNKILDAGEVLPEHIEALVNQHLKLIDQTKKQILKEIKKFEPK